MGDFSAGSLVPGLRGLLLLTAALTGCASSPILAPQPTQTSRPVTLTAPVSYVAVPITIRTTFLAQELSRRLSDGVGEDGIVFRRNVRTRIPGTTVTFGVHRSGPVSVRVVDQRLTYRVPLALNSGEIEWHGCAPGVGCRDVVGAFGGSGVLSGETTIRVEGDWRINARTRFRFVWLEEPWVHLQTTVDHGRVPLHPVVDLLLRARIRRLLASYAKRVDDALERVDLHRYLEPAWHRAHAPQRLAGDQPIWLCVEGESIGIGPPQGDDDNVRLTPVVTARLRVHVGEHPNIGHATPPLPRNTGYPGHDISEILLPITVEYSYLNALLKDRVAGRTFTLRNGARVTIKDVELLSAGNRLVARVEFDADRIPNRLLSTATGTVYFSGRPTYDRATHHLSVQDFDLDVETQEYLHKVSAWLAQDTFVERVRQRLAFDVSKKVEPLLDRFGQRFSTVELTKGITLTTRIHEVAMEGDQVVGADSVTIVAIARGSARIHVDAAPQIESLQASEREAPESVRPVDRDEDDFDIVPQDDPIASTP